MNAKVDDCLMAKIYILGTSNSVIGVKGYAEALGLRHNVTNRSSGRSSLAYHVCHILQNRVEIEAHDLLIIDHYGNDANFYRGFFGEKYSKYLAMYYQLLATLNVPVLNLMFPRLTQKYPEVHGLVRDIAERHGITSVDLNEAGFRRDHFMDAVHINYHSSYMMGIFLSQALDCGIGPKPIGGELNGYPLRVIPAREFAPDLPLKYLNTRVSRVEYVQLDRERPLLLEKDEKVISIGYYRDKNETLNQGFVLDGKPYGLVANDAGFFQEMASVTLGVQTSIAPITGYHDKVEVLARRGRVSGEFALPFLVNLLVKSSSRSFSGHLASHKVFEVPMTGLISAIDATSAKVKRELSEAEPARPVVRPAAINYLRDTALKMEDSELDRAIDLMEIAHFLRPQGPLIARKLKELRRKRGGLSGGRQFTEAGAASGRYNVLARLRRVSNLCRRKASSLYKSIW